ncbi:MAG: hypothetical protein K0Q95_2187 [Bacteroidota bacterium]|jgi:hypothetical protein|nr:hypothetical protein [Bacteroidota bacterium]
MKKNLLLILSSALTFSGYSQKEADNWYFGTFAKLSFVTGSPVAGVGSLASTEGTASISSPSGATLFYTDGVTVWDVTNSPMPNGTGLMGDGSSSQSAIVVPSPTSPSQYYLFTTPPDGGTAGFRYSMVDMTLNAGKGDVTATKNVMLTDSIAEKICAIKDAFGSGYWIMVHKWGTDEFYAYHLTATGIAAPVVSHAGSVHTTTTFQNTYGQMKFNMCGDKLALAIGYQDKIELFDFNKSTGVVSNAISFPMGYHVYGVEFSQNSQNLYATTYDPSATLVAFNITLPSETLIAASKVPLSNTSGLYALQIGSHGKIYVAESFGSPFLGVINNPDIFGAGANYDEMGITIDPNGNGTGGSLGLPSFLQDYLKENIECTVGIAEDNEKDELRVYPNPSSSNFILRPNREIAQVRVFDNMGRLIETFQPKNSEYIFGNNYSSGVYFISVQRHETISYYKVVKE